MGFVNNSDVASSRVLYLLQSLRRQIAIKYINLLSVTKQWLKEDEVQSEVIIFTIFIGYLKKVEI
jgi:hypothetical protein